MTVINGIDQSAVYQEVYEIDNHLHNMEIWFGKSADQSGNDWALEVSMTSFQAISGNADYGADANDEAKVLGTLDTPARSGKKYFDLHRIFVNAVSADTIYYLRIVYGTGTMAAAISALQYSVIIVKFDSANPTEGAGLPSDITMPRLSAGTKVWIQTKNATNNATIDFLVGIHEYDQ